MPESHPFYSPLSHSLPWPLSQSTTPSAGRELRHQPIGVHGPGIGMSVPEIANPHIPGPLTGIFPLADALFPSPPPSPASGRAAPWTRASPAARPGWGDRSRRRCGHALPRKTRHIGILAVQLAPWTHPGLPDPHPGHALDPGGMQFSPGQRILHGPISPLAVDPDGNLQALDPQGGEGPQGGISQGFSIG